NFTAVNFSDDHGNCGGVHKRFQLLRKCVLQLHWRHANHVNLADKGDCNLSVWTNNHWARKLFLFPNNYIQHVLFADRVSLHSWIIGFDILFAWFFGLRRRDRRLFIFLLSVYREHHHAEYEGCSEEQFELSSHSGLPHNWIL